MNLAFLEGTKSMSEDIKTQFRVVARCTIPAMERTYIFHDQIYDTVNLAKESAYQMMESRVGGEFIDVIITEMNGTTVSNPSEKSS